MDITKAKTRYKNITEFKSKLCTECADTVAPLALSSGVLILLSYVSDLISGGAVTLGESSAISKIMLGFGLISQNLITPVAAAVLSLRIGGTPALPSGLICGYFAQKGFTLQSGTTDTNSITGIYGGMIGGISAGLFYLLILRLLYMIKVIRSEHTRVLLSAIISAAMSTALICTVNSLAGIIRFLISALLSTLLKTGTKLPICIILGALIPADPIGTLHLTAYDYASSTLSSGSSDIMASAVAALISVLLGAGLSSMFLRGSQPSRTKICTRSNTLFAIGGIGTGIIPLYITAPLRTALSFIPGGIVSAMLSLSARCEVSSASGGLLNLPHISSPLAFVLACVCGGLLSASLYILFSRRARHTDDNK